MRTGARGTWVWLIGLAVVYLWWVHPLVGRPIMADETLVAENAMRPTYAVHLAMGHPPFYQELLRVGYLLFGWQFAALHWFGVACFLLQLALVMAIANRLQPGAGPLAALLWTTHPMAIQGSVILENDNTLLAVWMSVWLLAWLELPWPLRRRDCAVLGLLFFMGLWTKFSTPWALLGALLVWSGMRRRLTAGLVSTVQIAAWGIGWFLLAAVLYVQLYDFPWTFVGQHGTGSIFRGLHGAYLSLGAEWINRLLRIGLWFNPALLLVGLLIGWLAWRRRLVFMTPKHGMIWWYMAIVGVGYVVIRGLHFGFAKYHYPMLPALVAMISAGCVALGVPTTRRHWWWLGLGSILVAIAYAVIAGDVFYTLNYTLRTALIEAPTTAAAILRSLLLRWGVAALLVIPVYVIVRRLLRGMSAMPVVAMSLLVCILGANLATDAFQRTTAYSTTYCYGRSIPTMRELIGWLQHEEARHPGQYWLGAGDALLYAGAKKYENLTYWDHPTAFQQALANPSVRGLVISPTYNTVGFYREVLPHPAVQAILQDAFVPQRLGEYAIWLRREHQAARP